MRSIDDFWSDFLGVDVTTLHCDRCTVVPHAKLSGYLGAWLFVRGEGAVTSVPHELVAEIELKTKDISPAALHASAAALFGSRIQEIIGPVYLGRLDPMRFDVSARTSVARALTPADADHVAELARACTAEEWRASAIDVGDAGLVGAFDAAGRLVTAAKVREWAPKVGDIGVITHPGHRGQGYGRASVAEIVATQLELDWLLLYQTLDADTAAVAIAERIGFVRYATNLAVRLRAS
jgi:predicted GNAT family acetyltransferase